MKINPYLYFNGEAMGAIALYERAFGCKAIVSKFKEVGQYDPSFEIPAGREEWVMHANLDLGDSVIMVCDMPEPNRAVDHMLSENVLDDVFSAMKRSSSAMNIMSAPDEYASATPATSERSVTDTFIPMLSRAAATDTENPVITPLPDVTGTTAAE